jgi:hypothetical protein
LIKDTWYEQYVLANTVEEAISTVKENNELLVEQLSLEEDTEVGPEDLPEIRSIEIISNEVLCSELSLDEFVAEEDVERLEPEDVPF